VGSGGTGGFADVAVGSGGQRDAGGAGGVVSDGTVALDAGSPCGLAMGSASHTSGSNLAQLAVSHTVLGSNRLLVVAVAIRHDNGMPNTFSVCQVERDRTVNSPCQKGEADCRRRASSPLSA